MAKRNIVFIASEATPLAKTGGLADVVGSLPHALKKLQYQVTVILPFYRQHLADAKIKTQTMGITIEIWADGQQRQCPLHQATVDGLNFILVEQDDLYDREGIYGPAGGAYDDNFLRFFLFSRAALEAAATLPEQVDIIHCHDWQAGLIPLLLKSQYSHLPTIAQASTVYTIHNLAYQGVFPAEWIHRLGIPSNHFNQDGYEFYDQINCMKGAVASCDAVTTVSPSYAEEILTAEYGCALEGFLGEHVSKLSGIINGLDVAGWDPFHDTDIIAPYGPTKTGGKAQCKQDLQQHCGFEVAADIPLLTIITRLAEQKGIDLLIANIETWMERGYQLAVLGSGDAQNEQLLDLLAHKYSAQMYFYKGFNVSLARKIYAGGDIFLMPSRFEPCGLGQLMAMRYGAVPVVRATGGLRDTVTDYNASKKNATGIHFTAATAQAFDKALEQAITLFKKPTVWRRIKNNAMRRDSSWDVSAKAYAKLYESLIDA